MEELESTDRLKKSKKYQNEFIDNRTRVWYSGFIAILVRAVNGG
jgi:hypothetical protein